MSTLILIVLISTCTSLKYAHVECPNAVIFYYLLLNYAQNSSNITLQTTISNGKFKYEIDHGECNIPNGTLALNYNGSVPEYHFRFTKLNGKGKIVLFDDKIGWKLHSSRNSDSCFEHFDLDKISEP